MFGRVWEQLEASFEEHESLPSLPPFPDSQDAALQQLSSFFGSRLLDQVSLEHHQRILQLLTTYPSLAQIRFGKAYPLHYMAGANGVALDTLVPIYHLSSHLSRESFSSFNYFPLHHACNKVASSEVIRFLKECYPPAVQAQCEMMKRPPLHYAVTHYRTPIQTLETLLNAYPGCVAIQDVDGHTPLDLALNDSGNPGHVEFLLRCSSWKTVKLAVCGDSLITPSDLKRCLVAILPHITKLEWRLNCDTHLPAILEAIMQNNNHRLSLDLLLTQKMESLRWETAILPLTNNAVLESLKINLDRLYQSLCGHRLADDFYASCTQIWLGASTHCRTLHLELIEFQVRAILCPLTELVRCTTSPNTTLRHLTLTGISLVDADNLDMAWTCQHLWERSQLTHLTLHNCVVPPRHLQSWLRQIAEMPHLTHLRIMFQRCDAANSRRSLRGIFGPRRTRYNDFRLWQGSALNITQEVVAILERGQLREITVVGPMVEIEPVASVLNSPNGPPLERYQIPFSLQTPQQRKALEQLFPENVILKHVKFPPSCNVHSIRYLGSEDPEVFIEYHLELNDRWGRAQWHNMTMPQLVQLLVRMEINLLGRPTKGPTAFQAQYECLRRIPGIWSR